MFEAKIASQILATLISSGIDDTPGRSTCLIASEICGTRNIY